MAITCLTFYTIGNNYFYVEFCWSKEYTECSYAYRVFYYFVSMTVKRSFYYNPFTMTTGAIVASGLGYNDQKNGEH